jgi:hypothetical protein
MRLSFDVHHPARDWTEKARFYQDINLISALVVLFIHDIHIREA